jgi:hypothetical protein
MKKILLAVAAVVVVAAVAIGAWAALGGDDEATARGTCGGASYSLSRESDDDGLEVTFELQSAAPGETWNVSILQGDTPILTGERTTDEDAELDVDAPADDAAGTGFTVEATPAAGGDTCTASVD